MTSEPNALGIGVARLAILASHPVQYYAPLFRELAQHVHLHVFYAHRATPEQQAAAGFGTGFDWDVDLTSGYSHSFLRNVADAPGTSHFAGCDTPEISLCLREGRFGAVLALGWHLKSMVQGIWAAKRLGLPVVVRGDSHLDTPRGAMKSAVKALSYPMLMRVFDACLYVGLRNKAYYQHYGVPEARLFHSPHCVDTARFREGASAEARSLLRKRLDVNSEEKLVLFSGKLLPFKRPLDVVDAVALVRRSGLNASVVVAGSGPLEGEMRVRAQTLSVPLHVLGFQNQSAMPAAYAASDVVVLPSSGRETWGLVCNEALACGRGIIVSDKVGCGPDLAADNAVGQMFPIGNIHEFAKCLERSLVMPPSLEEVYALSERFSMRAAADGVVQSLKAVGISCSERGIRGA
jgi:glycosyltransferase involved in cell wall biosynthesis